MLDTTLNKLARQNAGYGAGGGGVRWKACVTTSGNKTWGMGLGGGGVRWIGRATTSRDKTRGTGEEEVGYAG